jgi:GMP synthase (glutamine-hydrolysing)
MNLLIVDNLTSGINTLENALKKYQFDVVNYDKINKNLINGYDKIILSGGHAFDLLHKNNKYKKELLLIKNSKKPIFGICLGFQLICRTFGASMGDLKRYHKGILKISRLRSDSLLKGLPKEFGVFEYHRHIVKSVGKSLVPLAKSKDGIEIVKHVSKPIWGTQFHPEKLIKANLGRKVLINFIKF